MRLALIITLCFAVPVIVLTKFLYEEHKKKLYEAAEWSLQRDVKAAAERKPDPNSLGENEELFKIIGNSYSQFLRRGNALVVGSVSGVDQRWPVSQEKLAAAMNGSPQFDRVTSKGEPFVVVYFPVERGTVLRVGRSVEDIAQYTAGLRRYTFFYPAVVVTVSFVLGWFLAGLAVAPTIQIRERARDIMQKKSAEAIPATGKGKEVDRLVEVVNLMLKEIHDSLETHKRFTSDLSHEIRSPLTSLIGNTEVALRRRRSEEEYEDLLRDNLAELTRLSRITDNILFLSRADSNILELRKQRFDVAHLLRGLLDRFHFKAERAGVKLEAELDKALTVFGDINLLEQAFANLIDNAIKYSRRGGIVTVAAGREEHDVRVAVRDTGIGIPEDEIPHIFDRFYRVQGGSESRVGGTGLGLSITKWIITANNGTISVRSVQGQGSEFLVVLHEERNGKPAPAAS